MKCFYCDEILTNRISIKKIIDNKNLLAFYHTKPCYEFHAVIVPTKHVSEIFDLEDKLLKEVFSVAKKIIKKQKLDKTGFRIITNGGKYQDGGHLHFHLVSGKRIK